MREFGRELNSYVASKPKGYVVLNCFWVTGWWRTRKIS